MLRLLLVPHLCTIWFIDAHTTVGSVQSEAIGPHRPEKETSVGEQFHSVLVAWKLAVLATFHHDLDGAGTWHSSVRNGYLTRAVQILRFDCFVMLLRRCCAQLWTWQSGHGALCLIWWFSARGRLRCLLFGGRMRCVGSHRTPTGILQESYRNPVGFLQDSYRNHTGLLQEAYRNPAGLLQDSHTTPTGLLQDSYRKLVGFPQDS